MGSYRYDYFLLPNPLPSSSCTGRDGTTVAGVDLNDQNTWTVDCGLTARQVATLDYLSPNKGFLCRTDAAVNPLTGVSYRTQIAATLVHDGIAPLHPARSVARPSRARATVGTLRRPDRALDRGGGEGPAGDGRALPVHRPFPDRSPSVRSRIATVRRWRAR